MKGWQIALMGLLLGVVDVGVPYLLLRDVTRFWINYVFWTVLTLVVLILGLRRISGWKTE